MAIVTTSPNPLEVQSLTDKKELLTRSSRVG